jgi:ectoine hydroxylase-related dioxygenase (phytanoyl-CoA dioxygenase family)
MKDTSNIDLTDEQVNFFWQYGYLCLNQITTTQEIERLKIIYDYLIKLKVASSTEELDVLAAQQKLPFDDGKTLIVLIPFPEKVAPELKQAIYFKNSLKIAARLFGVEEAKVIGSGRMIFKPAQHGSQMPWHQDAAYPVDYLLKIWMPLDSVNAENGCLQFIKGSHLKGLRPHRSYPGDPSGLSLMIENIDNSQVVICPLPAGGATVHHCCTLHYSKANTTKIPRRAFVTVCSLA